MLALLKLGIAGIQVLQLVNDLKTTGFKPDADTGDIFSEAVKLAVMAFQSAHLGPNNIPLKVDGEVGPLTRWALDVALGTMAAPQVPDLPGPASAAKPPHTSARAWNALKVARAEIGQGEEGSDNHGPAVMKYHAGTGAKAGDSWCASFASYCFVHGNPGDADFKHIAGARAILEHFKKKGWGYNATVNSPPLPGDIIVWWRGSAMGWLGHIGIVDSYDHGLVTTIEGNRGPYPSKVKRFQYTLGQIDKLLGWGRVP
jgi:hypothetical protein